MSEVVTIGRKAWQEDHDSYTSRADALVLARMIERHGLGGVLREIATLTGDRGDACEGPQRRQLHAINAKLFAIGTQADRAE